MSAVLQSALDPNDGGDRRHYIIRRLLCRPGDLFGQIENSTVIVFPVFCRMDSDGLNDEYKF